MHFGKSVMDNGYGKFWELLEYKLTWSLLKFRNLCFEKDGAENEQIREIR